jgi:hypothetical protein
LGCTRGQTVNSVCYSEMLWEQLKLAIWTKCRAMLLEVIAMFYSNAHHHTPVHITESLYQLNFDV